MRCRHDVVLIVISLGLILLAIGAFVLADLELMPFGMLGWLFCLTAFWYGVPLALIFALCAAIIYFSDRRLARQQKASPDKN
jgi:hypothetical protein